MLLFPTHSTSNSLRKHSGFGHKGNGGLKLDTLPELTAEKIGSATSRGSSGSSTSSILDTKLPGISSSGLKYYSVAKMEIWKYTQCGL